jgi:hypothetical protein
MVLNEENVKKKLDELMALRGKRGTSKKDQIAQVEPYVNLMPHTSYLRSKEMGMCASDRTLPKPHTSPN